uniref:Uncharacterized protein n=1 Tax=Virus NIOZ-UU157 TaxID=2763269 RepID=A0A7S9SUS4_9VIRU|nr:MAG: hypothetical protein NIOZUU157_00309 [Virus NIOZ-UU157]
MKIILSIILWIVVARIFMWIGTMIWPEDKDNFDNFGF